MTQISLGIKTETIMNEYAIEDIALLACIDDSDTADMAISRMIHNTRSFERDSHITSIIRIAYINAVETFRFIYEKEEA